MNKNIHKSTHNEHLPRREQQVLDLVYALGHASVHDIQAQLPDQPTYSATRMLLQRLHKKGVLEAQRDGARYVYRPSKSREQAGKAAIQRVLKTFFNGSPADALSTLLADERISPEELAELEALVARARREESP
jgi:predicted transcriptional regulator